LELNEREHPPRRHHDILTKEAETQKVIKDSRLDASALVTELFGQLRSCFGHAFQGGGASGNFAGGATECRASRIVLQAQALGD